ncbi:helix-turn-helix domain-containing protein [Prosthecobacter sp.]|uniref:helix-turn-helix domain-containing protein n=1 Tax=Prosthecobacter sp. TaxID=1965333 RepID=UPI0037C8ABF3
MMENEDPGQNRPPSRAVKLLFDQLWQSAFGHGAKTPTESEFSDNPTESDFRTWETLASYNTGGRAKLKQLREAKGLTPKQLAELVGYSLGVYQNIEEGHSNMSRKMAEKVAQALGCEVDGLLNGSDHPPANGTHHGTVGETPDLNMPPGQKARFVPLLSMAQCGSMMAYNDDAYDHSGFIAQNPKDSKAFAVTLAGDSMVPDFRPGDTAIIYPSTEPRNGTVVIARLNEDNGGDVMLKLYQKAGNSVTLSSYNPAYPPMTFPRDAFLWIYPVASVTRVL